MDDIKFEINKKIEFIFENGDTGISLIQDVKEDFILVTVPMKGNKKQLVHIGDKIEGRYYKKDKVYLFTFEALGRIVDNIPLIKMDIPRDYKIIQRRNYVRLPISIPYKYIEDHETLHKEIKNKELKDIDTLLKNRWEKVTTIDISGGGIKACVKKPIKVGTKIYMKLRTEELYIGAWGRVVRCVPSITNGIVNYHLGIEFIDIPQKNQEELIRFIFTKLREQQKRFR